MAIRRRLAVALALSTTALLAGGQTAGAQAPSPTVPPGFETVTLVSGLTRPIAIDWAPDGRMFIAEKVGRVLVLRPGETTARLVIDISDHVNSPGDRGLTGIAVDRDFASNGYLWLLYNFYNGGSTGGPKTARLTRIAIAPNDAVVNPSSPETVVLGSIGTPPCPAPSNTVDCIPSGSTGHTVGTVRSDKTDGTLWVGNGDTSTTGAFNLNTYNEQSFMGKLIHVDRNGRGLPGHGFCPTDNDLTHVCTKIHAKGFRSPFRFTLRAGKPPILADVGWITREELNIVQKGKNYGWPCYEGAIRTPGFATDSRCAPTYALEGTANAAAPPVWDCGRPPCSTLLAGPTYTATAYPPEYRGDTFFGDYQSGWLRRLKLDSADRLVSVVPFATGVNTFVDLELAPNGNLTYVDIGDFSPGTGSVRQIRYTQSNQAPTANATADRTFGPAPLRVAFNGGGSTDPEDDPLTYDWDFGDGTAHGSQANPVHTYNDGTRNFTATLTVRDGNGGSDTATVQISPGNTPPRIDSLTVPATYRDGTAVTVRGTASDSEDGSLAGSALSWQIRLRHAEHFHDFDAASGGSTTFTTLTDHDADSNYDVIFTARDSRGVTSSRTVTMLPETAQFTLASSPAGAPVTYGSSNHTAPFSTQSAIGLRIPVSAAARFTKDGTLYEFAGWSDGAARVHEITVPASNSTLTATYRVAPPTAYRTEVLATPTLESYWRLGEQLGTTALDELERHPGSYLGGVSLGQAGALAGDPDTAARFDGSNDELTVGALQLALNPGTLEGWFHWEAGVALMRDSNSVNSASYILAYDSAGKLAYRVAGRSFVTARTTASVRNGWHHFALTTGTGSATLYVDGQAVHNATGIPLRSAVMPWRVMRNGIHAEFSRGRADEIAIYGSVLAPETIADHYDSDSAPPGDTTPPAAPAGLAATAGDGSVALNWSDNAEPDLGGYDVYRSNTAGGPYTKLNAAPVGASSYSDETAQNGTTYHYVVRAVDTSGNASGDSSEVSATPSGPPTGSYEELIRGTAGLKAYWRLGESLGGTAVDELGSHPGSYLGGVSVGQPGAIAGDPDTAASFNGVDGEMAAGAGPAALSISAGTLEGWFHWDGGVALMRDNSAASNAGWILAYDSAGNLAYRVAGKSFVTARPTASVQTGWHHFALTTSGGSATLYVDGQPVHNATGIPARAAAMPWHLMRNGTHAQHGLGRADEVAVYNTRLTAQTVAEHHTAGR